MTATTLLAATNPTAAEELLRAVATAVVFFLLFAPGTVLLHRVGLAPDTTLSSAYAPSREVDRDGRDRLASLWFWLVLFGSMFVAFALVDQLW